MIVKDEKDVIERCLNSVKPIIDYWVIVDTGSTDGTKRIIQKCMKDIPGELHERPWVNFAHNRNLALHLAKEKSDYLLFIDADERLEYAEDFALPSLDKDAYYFVSKNMGTTYHRLQMISTELDVKWEGVLHEGIDCSSAKSIGVMPGVLNMISWDGNRSKNPQKYALDAEILEKALQDEPTNTRYVFYLAQSYRDAKNLPAALKQYERRALMGGSRQEVFWSLLEVGKLKDQLHFPEKEISKGYMKAFQYMPTRIEPLYYLARKYRLQEEFLLGYILSGYALSIPCPEDYLFLEKWIYDFGLWEEFANCSFQLGKYEEAAKACSHLLSYPDFSKEFRIFYKQNLSACIMKMKHPPKFEGFFEEYSHNRLDLIGAILPENPVIVEAGAHYGTDTVKFLKKWPQATIYAFEPNPHAYEKAYELTKNIPQVKLHPLALNTYNGTSTLNISHGPNGNNPLVFEGASSLLKPSDYMEGAYQGPKVEVQCVILDDWCAENEIETIDFLWLDMEGMELQTLQSSPEVLKSAKVIYTETNFQEFRIGMTQYKEIKAFLESKGFQLLSHWYEEGFQGDAIFVKKELFALPFKVF